MSNIKYRDVLNINSSGISRRGILNGECAAFINEDQDGFEWAIATIDNHGQPVETVYGGKEKILWDAEANIEKAWAKIDGHKYVPIEFVKEVGGRNPWIRGSLPGNHLVSIRRNYLGDSSQYEWSISLMKYGSVEWPHHWEGIAPSISDAKKAILKQWEVIKEKEFEYSYRGSDFLAFN